MASQTVLSVQAERRDWILQSVGEPGLLGPHDLFVIVAMACRHFSEPELKEFVQRMGAISYVPLLTELDRFFNLKKSP